MQNYTVYLYLQIAQHVSGGISTHHQQLISLNLQYCERDYMGTAVAIQSHPRQVAVTVSIIPDTVDPVTCAADDG